MTALCKIDHINRNSCRRDRPQSTWCVPAAPPEQSLLHVSGWSKVEKVLQAIDVVEALGIDPADAAPEHWRHVHNRMFVGEQTRPEMRSRHQAWPHRRKFVP
jgi:hypothetical protein